MGIIRYQCDAALLILLLLQNARIKLLYPFKGILSVAVNTFFFFLSRVVPTAYGSSQARDRIGAAATGLHHHHRNIRFGPHLQPTLQLAAMPDS